MATKIKVPKTVQDILDPGDLVEYGITAEVKHPKQGSFWVKAGATITVRDGEVSHEAVERVTTFVTDMLSDGVAEVLA